MYTKIDFQPLTLTHKSLVQSYTLKSENRNCDMNFMNLFSWRFMYQTQIAVWEGWLIFRFFYNNHLAYLIPVGEGDWRNVLCAMMRDAEQLNHPFLLMGVREHYLPELEKALPGYFQLNHIEMFSDYVYLREKMLNLSGKKLQSKRNFVNRFQKLYPNFTYKPLTVELIPECLTLAKSWQEAKLSQEEIIDATQEYQSLQNVFNHWEELSGVGGCLFVEEKLVAFTYGGAINYDTFDICVEKADINYEGAFAMINREFVKHIPERYIYINREEDLGIEGLRKAKQSYYPAFMINKFSAIAKHPFTPPPCPCQAK